AVAKPSSLSRRGGRTAPAPRSPFLVLFESSIRRPRLPLRVRREHRASSSPIRACASAPAPLGNSRRIFELERVRLLENPVLAQSIPRSIRHAKDAIYASAVEP